MRALLALFACFLCVSSQNENADVDQSAVYKIEGKVSVENAAIADWAPQTRILVNGGEYIGFVKSDGSFIVSNVPPGSHLVEIQSPNYLFESARVEISSKSKGKMRARKVDPLQPGVVQQIKYPLSFKTKKKVEYFEKREKWRLTDTLLSPMVLMMLLPVLLLTIMPRIMGSMDAEQQKEMQKASQSMFNTRPSEVFDFSGWLQRTFSSGSSRRSAKAIKNKRK